MTGTAAIENSTPTNEVSRRGPNRISFDTTVHPDTISKIDALCAHYACSRGQVVDKLVSSMWFQLESVKLGAPSRFCLSGERCRYNLTDVPPVL